MLASGAELYCRLSLFDHFPWTKGRIAKIQKGQQDFIRACPVLWHLALGGEEACAQGLFRVGADRLHKSSTEQRLVRCQRQAGWSQNGHRAAIWLPEKCFGE